MQWYENLQKAVNRKSVLKFTNIYSVRTVAIVVDQITGENHRLITHELENRELIKNGVCE